MKTSIVWFKTDLRLRDNQVLMEAIKSSDEIIPVYCFDNAHFKTTEFGFKKTGAFRTQFLFESLSNLNEQLKQFGSSLIVVRGNPSEELEKLVIKYKATKIFAKKEIAFEELQTQQAVEKSVWKHHCSFEIFSTSTLYHAQDLPFSIKDIPDMFTSFRKKVEKESEVRQIVDNPQHIKSPNLPQFTLPSFSNLNLTEPNNSVKKCYHFIGGETKALERLNYYFNETKLILNYKETRNGLLGGDYSTKFSPWLALGCISPRYILHKLHEFEAMHGSNESTYWLVFELLWRDYFRFMMKKHKEKIFLKNGYTGNSKRNTELNKEKIFTWVNGQTQVDFVDANMLELKHTGFLSNRGRQNVASYFCNDLKLDWRYGAAYFEEQLIDYDVSSNWGNWAYIAGVGSDPRSDRYFNIERQQKMYDPNNLYVNFWLETKKNSIETVL